MQKFKIRDTYKYLSEIYEVEAETKEEALDKYVNVMAGSLERLDVSYEPEAEDSIEVLD
jgi:hypothetical protein